MNEDDPRRKYKYRVVFRGDQTKDQNLQAAIFQNMGSAPASMVASKMADCYGCMNGNVVMQADAQQAYVQSKIGGPPTYVCIPKYAWPPHWHNKELG